MHVITSSWQGHEPLWKVFWIYHWALGVAANVVALPLLPRIPAVLQVVLCVSLFAWWVWVSVSIWRCAFNTQERIFGLAARAYVAVTWLGLVVMGCIAFVARDLLRLPH